MIQIKDLSKIALCSGEKPPAVMQSFTAHVTPDIGFLIQFFPSRNRVIQNKAGYKDLS